MKIALSFPGCHRKGGVERVVFECARFLAARRHEVHILAAEWEPIAGDNVHFHRTDIPRSPAFLSGKRYFHAASRQLAGIPHDVLNTHGCVCPVGGVHWVQSLHAAWLDRAKTMRHPLSLARLKQHLNPVHPILLALEREHFQRRQYRRLITTTVQVAEDLARYYGVPRDDVTIIPNGFNPAEFNPVRRAQCRAERRSALDLAPDDIALLFVANELPRKGYFVLLEALRRIGNPHVKLLAIGRPPGEAVLAPARAMGLGGQVRALGPCSDVSGMHAAADLFVLPTQYEAFSLAILESLGSGLPVLTTSVPGAADAILPGVNGFVQKDPRSADELVHLLQPLLSHERLAALAASTAGTVDQYQWPTLLLRYETLLAQHASERAPAPVPA